MKRIERRWIKVTYRKKMLEDPVTLETFIRNYQDWEQKRQRFQINVIEEIRVDNGNGYEVWKGGETSE